MFGALLLSFPLMVFVTLLSLSMRIQNIYGIILLLQNLMCFLHSIVFKCLLSVSFHTKLNLFKLIRVVNIGSEIVYSRLLLFITSYFFSHTHEQNDIVEHRHRYIMVLELCLNCKYILSIIRLLLSSKINLRLSVCFIVLLIMIFGILLGVFVLSFLLLIMVVSWIFIHLHMCFIVLIVVFMKCVSFYKI